MKDDKLLTKKKNPKHLNEIQFIKKIKHLNYRKKIIQCKGALSLKLTDGDGIKLIYE